MAQSQVVITINSNASANQINSALECVRANNPEQSVVCLINFLRKITAGVIPDTQFVIQKAASAGTVTFDYGVVVTATPTPTPTFTPSVTPTPAE